MSASEESSNVIYYQPSPDGTIHAVVEQDDRVAYFYLSSDLPHFATRAVWVRNLVPGPITLDTREMQQGLAPTLPRLDCVHPQGAPPLVPKRLQVVWFEQGNGAALFDGDEILAIVPPWSGEEGFHGYARDCKSENAVCWPIPQDPQLLNRIRSARAWWQSWQTTNPWQDRQQALLNAYEQAWGRHERYFSIDGEKWPPKGLVWFRPELATLWVTLGVSIRPQPMAEMMVEHPEAVERFELGVLFSRNADAGQLNHLAHWLSSTANYPWYQQTWLGHGHTTTWATRPPESPESPPQTIREGFPFVLLVEHRALVAQLRALANDRTAPILDLLAPLELPDYRGAPTNLLWAVPLTATEQQIAAGPRGRELLTRLLETPERLWCDGQAPAALQ